MTQDLTSTRRVRGVEPVREYDIRGGGGITLHAREWGNPTARRFSSSTAGRNATCAGAPKSAARSLRTSAW